MPNTTLTHQMVAREAAMLLKEESPFIANINLGREEEFGVAKQGYKAGETVRVQIPNTGVVYEGATFAGGGAAADNTEKFVNLTLLPQKHIGLTFTAREKTLDISDFKERILRPQMRTLASWVEADMLKRAYSMVPNLVGTPGTVPSTMKVYAQAREKLQNYLAPPGDRSVLFSSAANTELVDTSRQLFHSGKQIERGFLRGDIGEAQGADFFEHQSIPAHVNGTATAFTVNGAAQVGSTLNIGGLTAAQTITAGTVFTLPGVFAVHPLTGQPYTSLQQFTVTANFTATGTTGTISIFPEIQPLATLQNRTVSASPASAAAAAIVAATGNRQNLMFHKDAFAGAFVPLAVPEQFKNTGYTATIPGGISVRVYTFSDGVNDRDNTRIDVMYGIQAVRGLHACRITE